MAIDPNLKSESAPPPNQEGYEKRDANVNWLFAIIGLVLLLVAGSELGMKWVGSILKSTQPPADQLTGAHQTPENAANPKSFPRLQISPPQDLQKLRAREDVEMTTYGWINATAGIVRIPVEQAMDLLLKRGLPVRAGVGQSRFGPTWLELQQQRTNATQSETEILR